MKSHTTIAAIFGLLPLFFAPGLGLPQDDILIFRPLENNAASVDPDELLIVPGGTMLYLQQIGKPIVRGGLLFPFEAEVSAMAEIVEIRVNGKIYSRPRSSWQKVSHPILLAAGDNQIVIVAKTDDELVEKEFVVHLNAIKLPGVPFFVATSPKAP